MVSSVGFFLLVFLSSTLVSVVRSKRLQLGKKGDACLWIDGCNDAIRRAGGVLGQGKKRGTLALSARGGFPLHPLIQNCLGVQPPLG